MLPHLLTWLLLTILQDFEVRCFVGVTQQAVSKLPMHPPEVGGDKRHLSDPMFPFMEYDAEKSDGSFDCEFLPLAWTVILYILSLLVCTGCIGVHHDYESWFEQGHKVKFMYPWLYSYSCMLTFVHIEFDPIPSADLLQSNTRQSQSATCYSINLDHQSSLFNAHIERFFLKEYATLSCVAAAGWWIPENWSCFLGMVTVWKLNVNVHIDQNDWSICALTCSGNFMGGHLHLPDPNVTLQYVPLTMEIAPYCWWKLQIQAR